ncbi:bifunctional hydroxymethylpyrimidine kinase/phosphomethylpyrimidine kinase [Paenibacillus abyssi]|uniref:Hydroxymethylpyrimidine/phosphomethylpyrimidine kinase n=1 Tax=Paenibacillus abyssi TaxID=1340531 RepID=A0A917D222_9BACL|nr:bifunctional hydroxymethylpyrimidine kinase/phosphomethylpyrimidine kinase [Paenibacillus abyssi]GGG03710.1 hydroxymethylpyrimidine/phosphomethylpyrimidine kinase [Paenibacillus abyssi]
MRIKKALTIAGSDSGGGAGIQADLKTFQELGVFGMSALTAVTAQNTLGVQAVFPMTAEAVKRQIQSVGDDMGADAVKTGMLFNAEIIQTVAAQIKLYNWRSVVVDPVMIAKGGASLLQEEAISALKSDLLPVALVVTPNIPEAEVLTQLSIQTADDKKQAARKLAELGTKYVLIKGGHDEHTDEAVDLLYDGSEFHFFSSKRIQTKHTHGTGCTFSAAIAAGLAQGGSVYDAVSEAKRFIQAAVEDQLLIGGGHGPTNHWAYGRRKGDDAQ